MIAFADDAKAVKKYCSPRSAGSAGATRRWRLPTKDQTSSIDTVDMEAMHRPVVYGGASFADADAKAHDGVAVHAGQALDGSNGTALGQCRDDLHLLVKRENVHGSVPLVRGTGPERVDGIR